MFTLSKKQEKEETGFNIEEMYKTVNPYLLDGLKKYIFENDIKIKNEKEFEKVYKTYGGL